MIRQFALVAGLLTAVVLGIATVLPQVQAADAVEVGDKAPTFANLPGTDDKKYSLKDFADAKATVVVFTCNHCPVAVMYEDRFIEFAEDYKGKGVEFVAINVNKNAADRLPKMKERAEEKGFNFPYLFDETQSSARGFGARVTPHVFVLDGDQKIAYMGAFDDNGNPEKVGKEYVRDAVDAILAGKTPEVTSSSARGCGIQYERK